MAVSTSQRSTTCAGGTRGARARAVPAVPAVPALGPLAAICVLATSLIAGCADRERLTDAPPPAVEWEFGPATSYTAPSAPGGTIADSVSGAAFRFPAGGTGSVVVAPILSGPQPLFPGEGFSVDYAGGTEIQLVVDPEDAGHVMVTGYGTTNGSFSDISSDPYRWIAVPAVDTLETGVAFLLTPPFEGAVATRGFPPSTRRGFREYWISRIPAGADKITKMIHLERQSAAYIDSFLTAFPEPRRTELRTEATGRMHRHYQYDGCYYQGFWWRSLGQAGRLIRPTIHLRLDADAGNVAHETGHYITHLLAGDDAWSTLEGQAPLWDTDHGPLDMMGRDFMLEDYAYLAEWFLTGGVKAYDLHDPYPAFKDFTPIGRDFPSMEGFGAFLLGALTRTEPTMRDIIRGRPIDVPAPGLTDAEVFEIIARGAPGIEGLRNEIETALGPNAGQLPVIAQRTGWSYSVRGRLVGPTGQPVTGITTSSIYRVGETLYEGGYTTLESNPNGEFSVVGDVFPGRSFLRFVDSPDTAEVTINIDWSQHTDQSVNLGNLTVAFPPVIASLSAESGKAGDAIEILGRRFGASQGSSSVTFAGTVAAITQWEDERIAVVVPSGAASGNLVVTVGGLASNPVRFTISGTGMWVLESYAVLDTQPQNGTWLNINTFDTTPGGCSIRCGYDNPNFAEPWWGDWETTVACAWTTPATELTPGSTLAMPLSVQTAFLRNDESGESEKSSGWIYASCAGQSSRTLTGTESETFEFVVDPAPTWMPDQARMLIWVRAGGYSAGTAGGGYSGMADRKWTYRFVQ